MTVLTFKKKEATEQCGSGEAFCIGCNHKWVAVVPTGVTEFECPKCHTMKGKWKFEFYPEAGTLLSTCRCGNQLYYMTKVGHMCANCGRYQEYSNGI